METYIGEKVMSKDGFTAGQFAMKFLSLTLEAFRFEKINKSCAT